MQSDQANSSASQSTALKAGGEFVQKRLSSLDAYRGLIMITLAFAGFGLARTATLHLKRNPSSEVWQQIHHQFEHVQWVGCGYWDLIQPSFMFMVGVSMAFSYAKRRDLGQTYGRMFRHAVKRSLILIFLGIFLISNWARPIEGHSATNWSLMNVLTQIGLGYTFLFLLWDRPFAVQAIAAVVILVGTWGAYMAYPDAGINLQIVRKSIAAERAYVVSQTLGAQSITPFAGPLVSAEQVVVASQVVESDAFGPGLGFSNEWAQEYLTGVAAPWHKNANIGHAVDLHVLNWFPRAEEFKYNSGGYQTINFIPSLATMLFGLMCGELLRKQWNGWLKVLILVLAGVAAIAAGWALDWAEICPLVKRIWTPSWAIYSTGWCCLMLAGFYLICDVIGFSIWAFPLIVVGVNSIAIYCMGQLLKPWAEKTWEIHFGADVFENVADLLHRWFGVENAVLYLPTIQAVMIGFLFWLACLWMYRQKIHIRI